MIHNRKQCDLYRSVGAVRVMKCVSLKRAGIKLQRERKRDTYRNLGKKFGENVHLLGQEGDGRITVRWIL